MNEWICLVIVNVLWKTLDNHKEHNRSCVENRGKHWQLVVVENNQELHWVWCWESQRQWVSNTEEVNGEEDGPGMKRKLVGAYLQRIEAEAGQVCRMAEGQAGEAKSSLLLMASQGNSKMLHSTMGYFINPRNVRKCPSHCFIVNMTMLDFLRQRNTSKIIRYTPWNWFFPKFVTICLK